MTGQIRTLASQLIPMLVLACSSESEPGAKASDATVEAIKKRFLQRAFGDASGSLYEGTQTDLVEALKSWVKARPNVIEEMLAAGLGVGAAETGSCIESGKGADGKDGKDGTDGKDG